MKLPPQNCKRTATGKMVFQKASMDTIMTFAWKLPFLQPKAQQDYSCDLSGRGWQQTPTSGKQKCCTCCVLRNPHKNLSEASCHLAQAHASSRPHSRSGLRQVAFPEPSSRNMPRLASPSTANPNAGLSICVVI